MCRVTIIAEAGVNHNGSLDLALKLVDAAADVGADVVKFQTFRADALVTQGAPKARYQTETTDAAQSQWAMLKALELGQDDHRAILERCRARGIEFLSTPFDADSLRWLVGELGMARVKVGSGDMTNAPLLLEVARLGRPVILFTGMATLDEVREALGVLAFGYAGGTAPGRAAFAAALTEHADALRDRVTLLHCTTEYPAPPDSINLRAMDTLREAYCLPVGLSDHSQGHAAALAAVARGATVIEKHLTLDRAMPGPDHRASLEPAAFADLVDGVRLVEGALGDGAKQPAEAERANMAVARKSIVAARRIEAGEPFSADNLTLKRPGDGLAPIALWDLIGIPAPQAYDADEPIRPPTEPS
jgi:N-acetylneuraminate synthase